MLENDLTLEEDDLDWDNPTEVTFDFIRTGRSKADGILVTHDNNFKVFKGFALPVIFEF